MDHQRPRRPQKQTSTTGASRSSNTRAAVHSILTARTSTSVTWTSLSSALMSWPTWRPLTYTNLTSTSQSTGTRGRRPCSQIPPPTPLRTPKPTGPCGAGNRPRRRPPATDLTSKRNNSAQITTVSHHAVLPLTQSTVLTPPKAALPPRLRSPAHVTTQTSKTQATTAHTPGMHPACTSTHTSTLHGGLTEARCSVASPSRPPTVPQQTGSSPCTPPYLGRDHPASVLPVLQMHL